MIQPEILQVSAFRDRKIQTISWKVVKPDKSTPKSLLYRENFHHYMENSTLHGLKYAGDRRLSYLERYVRRKEKITL